MKKRILTSYLAILVMIISLQSQPVLNGVFTRDRQVPLYEKVELFLRMEATYENPFDPDDISIDAVFTSPSGKEITVPGFYNQSRYPGFRVRFSAMEKGTWTYQVHVKDRTGKASSEKQELKVTDASYHGPIQVAGNKRFLEHHDGTPWYGTGLWYNGEVEEEVLDELQEKGVNYISHLIQPLETRASGLGRYDQLLCEQIDEMLAMLEERDMKLALNFWFHSFLSATVWGGGNERWETNPYQEITDVKDFFSSEEAWQYQEKLYRYMIARWGYSRSLAIWFIVDEVNGTDGWVSGDSLGASEWVKKVHNYFKANDPWQHLTTGTRSGGVKEWWDEAYAVLDLAGREIYEAQGFPINTTGKIEADEIHPLTYSYRNYHSQVAKLWHGFEKPAIIPETGWDHTFYEMTMPGYQAQYHNAMWVCLASGSAMSPFWWSYSDRLNDNTVTYQIKSVADFASQLDLASLTDPEPVVTRYDGADIYAIKSKELIYGWAVNADADMSGRTIVLEGVEKGDYRLKLYHTWRGRFINLNDTESQGWGRQDPSIVISSKGKKVEFQVPVLKISGGHARYIGQDVAFVLEPVQ